MLRSIKSLNGYNLLALDGEIGTCKDFQFEDDKWVVRYLVANTGNWLIDHQVIISPISLEQPDWEKHDIPVKLTKEQIEKSPKLESSTPVSREFEKRWFGYFGWQYYWGGTNLWGTYSYPNPICLQGGDIVTDNDKVMEEDEKENHLRSVNEIVGNYNIHASDGEIGHIEDFIIEDTNWAIRYIIVDTRNWFPGKKVLISPQWVKNISWSTNEVEVDLTVEQVKNSPEFDPKNPVNRKYEVNLYDYYDRPKYWKKDQ